MDIVKELKAKKNQNAREKFKPIAYKVGTFFNVKIQAKNSKLTVKTLKALAKPLIVD